MCLKSLFLCLMFVSFASLKLISPVDKNIVQTENILSLNGPVKLTIADSISAGYRLALQHCQNEFKWDRWNCPSTIFTKPHKLPPTRETAFSKAILTAGIVHQITKDCSQKKLQDCGCNQDNVNFLLNKESVDFFNKQPLKKANWTWTGCSEDPSYAMNITKEHLNVLEKGKGATISWHNYNIGMQIVKETLKPSCRCHGLSGGCSVQTCKMKLAPFETISKKLRNKYNKAIFYDHNEAIINSNMNGPSRRKVKHRNMAKDLIFSEYSPNYCRKNETSGWPGTKGRTCTRNASKGVAGSEKRSCKNLCRSCGHKVKRTTKEIKEKCNCTFRMCCEVKCDICTKTIDEYACA